MSNGYLNKCTESQHTKMTQKVSNHVKLVSLLILAVSFSTGKHTVLLLGVEMHKKN